MFAVKFNPDGSVTRMKARLVGKGNDQTYGVDYSNTFSPVTKLTFVHSFISLVASYDWDLHQLDIKMSLYMEIFRKKFTWSNLRGLLVKGR